MGHTTFHAGSIEFEGRPVARCRSTSAAPGHGPGAAGERDIPFAHRRGESRRRLAARPLVARAVYELFPRLAERRGLWGNQISGGEQQMLAIGAR